MHECEIRLTVCDVHVTFLNLVMGNDRPRNMGKRKKY